MTTPATIDRPEVETRMPTYVDKARLCFELTISDTTADEWVKKKIIPPPIKRGGKLMWKWEKVEQWIDGDNVSVAPDDVDRVRDATRRACNNS